MIVGYYVKLVLPYIVYEVFLLTKNRLNVYKANLSIVSVINPTHNSI